LVDVFSGSALKREVLKVSFQSKKEQWAKVDVTHIENSVPVEDLRASFSVCCPLKHIELL